MGSEAEVGEAPEAEGGQAMNIPWLLAILAIVFLQSWELRRLKVQVHRLEIRVAWLERQPAVKS